MEHIIFFQNRVKYYNSDCSIADYKESSDDTESCTKKKRMKIVDHNVAIAADRTNVSSRKIFQVLSQIPGLEEKKTVLSATTIYRHRKKQRQAVAKMIKESFCVNSANLTVHWDAKIMRSLSNTGKVNRVVVLVVGPECEKLLGAPIAKSGCGSDESQVIINTLREWNLIPMIRAMCFDTTASMHASQGYRAPRSL